MKLSPLIVCLFALLFPRLCGAETGPQPPDLQPGFLVVASDRGFLGNEEIRDAFAILQKERLAELVFVTDERTRQALESAVGRLEAAGAERIVLLPLFISPAESRYQLVLEILEQCPTKNPKRWRQAIALNAPLEAGMPFGQSVFAVGLLAERIRHLGSESTNQLVVVGCGATDAASRRLIEADLQRLAGHAAQGVVVTPPRALAWCDWNAPDRESQEGALCGELKRAATGHGIVILPFHFGRKFDSMMSLNAHLRQVFRGSAVRVLDSEVTPHPHLAQWMLREANKFIPIAADEVGVVFLAHGADFHWNEEMREAAGPLAERFKLEFAFSMADPPVVERAVRRLEQRGARAIVVLRVFGMASSFKGTVDRILGLDIEGPAHEIHSETNALRRGPVVASSPSGGSSHGHGATGGRILSTALLTTVGGLEDHPLFAAALLERALERSVDPERETIVLTAHGSGSDETNDHWYRIIDSLAAQMRASGGGRFRAIETVTWREDWPEKRGPEIDRARRLVAAAQRENGRAIVIPARTTLAGPERKFLDGLDFELGRGFAPHPLFVAWMEQQIEQGLAGFRRAAPPVAACCVSRLRKE